MRAAYARGAGSPCPPFARCDVGRRGARRSRGATGYPLVVKPSRGWGQRGVARVERRGGARARLRGGARALGERGAAGRRRRGSGSRGASTRSTGGSRTGGSSSYCVTERLTVPGQQAARRHARRGVLRPASRPNDEARVVDEARRGAAALGHMRGPCYSQVAFGPRRVLSLRDRGAPRRRVRRRRDAPRERRRSLRPPPRRRPRRRGARAPGRRRARAHGGAIAKFLVGRAGRRSRAFAGLDEARAVAGVDDARGLRARRRTRPAAHRQREARRLRRSRTGRRATRPRRAPTRRSRASRIDTHDEDRTRRHPEASVSTTMPQTNGDRLAPASGSSSRNGARATRSTASSSYWDARASARRGMARSLWPSNAFNVALGRAAARAPRRAPSATVTGRRDRSTSAAAPGASRAGSPSSGARARSSASTSRRPRSRPRATSRARSSRRASCASSRATWSPGLDALGAGRVRRRHRPRLPLGRVPRSRLARAGDGQRRARSCARAGACSSSSRSTARRSSRRVLDLGLEEWIACANGAGLVARPSPTAWASSRCASSSACATCPVPVVVADLPRRRAAARSPRPGSAPLSDYKLLLFTRR